MRSPLYLLLLLPTITALTLPPPHLPEPYYTSIISPLSPLHTIHTTSPTPLNSSAWQRSIVSTTDDAVYDFRVLPFRFPFFGQRSFFVAIDPNGAISLNGFPPCCINQCVFSTFTCNLDTSYRNIIALFVADLYPGDPRAEGLSEVRVFSDAQALSVVFDQVPPYFSSGQSAEWVRSHGMTFSGTVFPSGRIVVRWTHVFPPRSAGAPSQSYLTGLRHFDRDAQYTLGPDLVANQYRDGWNRTGNGTYVPFHQVRSGAQLTWLPSKFAVCSGTRFVSTEGGARVEVAVDYYGLTQLQQEGVELFCRFHHEGLNVSASALPGSRFSGEWHGVAVRGSVNATRFTLVCDAPPSNSTGTAFVSLEARSLEDGSYLYQTGLGTANATFEYVEPGSPLLDQELTSSATGLPAVNQLCTRCEHVAALVRFDGGFCQRDCNNEWRGGAFIDSCRTCVGGSTGNEPLFAQDCYGTCFGPFSEGTGQCACLDDAPPFAGRQNSKCLDYTSLIPGPAPSPTSRTSRFCVSPRVFSTTALGGDRIVRFRAAADDRSIEDWVTASAAHFENATYEGAPMLQCWFGDDSINATTLDPLGVGYPTELQCPVPQVAVANLTVPFEVRFYSPTDALGRNPSQPGLVDESGAAPLFVTFLEPTDPRVLVVREPGDVECDDCAVVNSTYCVRDCVGTWRGSAFVDECGTCVGGKSGREPDDARDCTGICHGPFQAVDGQCGCGAGAEAACATAAAEHAVTLPIQGDLPAHVATSLLGQPISMRLHGLLSQFGEVQVPVDAEAKVVLGSEITLFNASSTSLHPRRVTLPFTVEFYGRPYRSVIVTSHGVVRFDLLGGTRRVANDSYPYATPAIEACGSHVFPGLDNAVAPLLLPGYEMGASTQISYIASSDALLVRFIGLVAPGGSASFEVAIFRSSLVLSRFVEVPPLPAGAWFSGTRPPVEDRSASVCPYPAPDTRAPEPGTTSLDCVVSRAFCVTPKQAVVNASVSVRLGASSDGTCLEELAAEGLVSCSFGGVHTPAALRPASTWKMLECPSPVLSDSHALANRTVPVTLTFANGSSFEFTELARPERALFALVLESDAEQVPTLSELQHCASCSYENPRFCQNDCGGAMLGNAFLNDCGVCATRNMSDCLGACFGQHDVFSLPVEHVERSDSPLVCSCATSPYDPIPPGYNRYKVVPLPPHAAREYERQRVQELIDQGEEAPFPVVEYEPSRYFVGLRRDEPLGDKLHVAIEQGDVLPVPGSFDYCQYYNTIRGPRFMRETTRGMEAYQVILATLVALVLLATLGSGVWSRCMRRMRRDSGSASKHNLVNGVSSHTITNFEVQELSGEEASFYVLPAKRRPVHASRTAVVFGADGSRIGEEAIQDGGHGGAAADQGADESLLLQQERLERQTSVEKLEQVHALLNVVGGGREVPAIQASPAPRQEQAAEQQPSEDDDVVSVSSFLLPSSGDEGNTYDEHGRLVISDTDEEEEELQVVGREAANNDSDWE